MKKALIALLFFAALPLAALAQYATLTPGYDGTPESYYGSWVANDENVVRLTATRDSFRLDSLRFYLYRATASVARTLNYRVVIYSRNGTIAGGCGCTTGPGTILKQYPSATTTYTCGWTGATTGATWFSQALPQDTIVGSFLIGIVYVSKSTGTFPSVLFDGETGLIACCDQYIKYSGTFYDNVDSFDAGPWYIFVKGTAFGALAPGHLTLSTLESMGGAAVDSTVDDTLVLGNSGGTTLTVSSVVSDHADFWTDPVGAGIVVAPAATALLAVHYSPSSAGDATANLTVTDNTPTPTTVKILTGRGIDPTNLMLFENWWNGNGFSSGWSVESFGEADTTDVQWSLYYTGTHSDGYTNVWAQHGYSPASDTLLDIIGSPQLLAPAGATVSLNFRDRVDFPSYYMGHFLALADSDSAWSLLNEMPPINENVWGDYPTTFYVTGLDSEYAHFQLGFTYYGADGDDWLVDDILIKDVPQIPPFLSAEPRGDAFTTDQELVAYCWDSNSDPFTLNALISANGNPAVSYAMIETPIGSSNFCLPFTSFISGAGTYDYYYEATDDDGTTRWPATGTYNFEVATQVGSTEIVYHDGAWNNAHYYNNMDAEEAVRFTPPSYPFQVTGANVGILNAFPNSVHEQIVVKVYADDGAGGLPGTLLYSQQTGSIGNECDGLNDTTYQMYLAPVVFRQNIVINSGTYYVAVKNPTGAVSPQVEAWCLDTLGSTNSYVFDPAAGTWSAVADSLGDVIISSLGFVSPAAPVLSVYNSIDNLSANIYVNSVVGAIPATNVYVSTGFYGAPALLAGAPFTASPIVYPFPVASGVTFFTAKSVVGPVDRGAGLPSTEVTYPRYSVVTPAPAGTPISASRDAVRVDLTKPIAAPLDFSQPTVIAVDSRSGKTQMTTISRTLGRTHSLPVSTTAKAARGPVRQKVANHTSSFLMASPIN